MQKKIIIWLNADITEFAISYYLQKLSDYDFYAIVDLTSNPRKFFETQTLVKFTKIWFYHDLVNEHNQFDNDFVKTFETQYDIPVRKLARHDRIFMKKFNNFYNFSESEISKILESECFTFEQILDEIKPDIFLTNETALRPHHFFYLLCKKKNLKILMLNSANWGNYCYISENYHKIDNFYNQFSIGNSQETNFEKQQKRLDSMKLSNKTKVFFKSQQSSVSQFLSAVFYYIFKSDNKVIESYYTYYGRTKFKVLFNEVLMRFKRKSRKNFIDKNLLTKIPTDKKMIFFPLQQEPERSLLLSAPDYADQIKNIDFIVESMPDDFFLIVKEHPTQGPPTRDWRKISDYKKILDNNRVIFMHPSVPADEIIKKSKLIISVSGTIALESAFFAVPSITFADNDYSIISSISKLNSRKDLPHLIKTSLKNSCNASEVKKYFDILEKNSFIFNVYEFSLSYFKHLYLDANILDVEISESNMNDLLFAQKENLERLANEFHKRIV